MTPTIHAGGFTRHTPPMPSQTRGSVPSIAELMARANQLSIEDPSGRTKEQIFAALLKSSPESYTEYLRQNPAQCGGKF